MSDGAVAIAVAVAAEYGLRADDPVVLRDAWHTLVHLRPLPVVARVSSALPYPQGPSSDDVARELAVAGHAARAGAPVIAPSDLLDPGPHLHDGRVVVFWRYVEPLGPADPVRAGEGLRAVHEALADFDGELPELHVADTLSQLDALEPSADVELLGELLSRRPAGPFQAVHGDAHLHNCFVSSSGVVWHDFETACRAPRELDLAALVLGERDSGIADPEARAALAAYGDHDAELLEECLPIYAAWIYVSFMVALPRRPELGPPLAEGLAWLRSTFR